MEARAAASARLWWTLAGLTAVVLFYGLLLSALAGRAAATLPADPQGWFAALGGL
jgi:hypothetical protein